MDTEVECPYRGEWVTIFVDPGGGPSQTYVEDCPVCCRVLGGGVPPPSVGRAQASRPPSPAKRPDSRPGPLRGQRQDE